MLIRSGKMSNLICNKKRKKEGIEKVKIHDTI